MDADAEYRIDERDFGLDDERPPDDTRHDADSPEPQWLRVLLWQQASPNAQVWVTVPAEGQPEGALWVGPANDPGPRSSRICVVTDPVAAAPAQSEPDSGPTRVGDAGSPPAGVVISAEGIGALAATGATLLTSSKGMETVVDRIVQAAVEGLVRVFRTDARLVRELVTAVNARGAPTEVVAMPPEEFAARWGFKRRVVYRLIQEGLPTTGEGKRRRIPVAEGDAWMSESGTTRIEERARQAAATVAHQRTRGNGSGNGMGA